MRQSLNPATLLRAAVACAVACTVSADGTPVRHTLVQSADGSDGHCRSGGKELPCLASAVGRNLTACGDACNEIEECAAFALADAFAPANCQLNGSDMALCLLPRNDFPTFMKGASPFESGFVGTVDSVEPNGGIKCHAKDPPTPLPPTPAATTAPAGCTLVQSADGSDGDCRSGGQRLPCLHSNTVSVDLTACSDACKLIERCAAFAFVGSSGLGNCQLNDSDMAHGLSSPNDWPDFDEGDGPVGSDFVGPVDTVDTAGANCKCYGKDLPPPADYSLLSSPDGSNGDCRSGGDQLPFLASAVSLDLTACSVACNMIEECAAFALADDNAPANCQLNGLDMACNSLPRNDWPNLQCKRQPF